MGCCYDTLTYMQLKPRLFSVLVTLVRGDAASGAIRLSPFNYQHFGVSEVRLHERWQGSVLVLILSLFSDLHL